MRLKILPRKYTSFFKVLRDGTVTLKLEPWCASDTDGF